MNIDVYFFNRNPFSPWFWIFWNILVLVMSHLSRFMRCLRHCWLEKVWRLRRWKEGMMLILLECLMGLVSFLEYSCVFFRHCEQECWRSTSYIHLVRLMSSFVLERKRMQRPIVHLVLLVLLSSIIFEGVWNSSG